jgi:hypothetical protein
MRRGISQGNLLCHGQVMATLETGNIRAVQVPALVQVPFTVGTAFKPEHVVGFHDASHQARDGASQELVISCEPDLKLIAAYAELG